MGKVYVPKFYADWLKDRRDYSPAYLVYCLVTGREFLDEKIQNWLDNNLEIAIIAIINGYDIENPKKYYARMKYIQYYNSFLNYNPDNEVFTLNNTVEINAVQTKFDKDWLRDNFEPFETLLSNGLIELIEVNEDD